MNYEGDTMQTSIFDRPIDHAKLNKAKDRIYRLLLDGQFHTTMEIINAGGASGLRRLRELRAEGHPIDCEPIEGSNEWRYRLGYQGLRH